MATTSKSRTGQGLHAAARAAIVRLRAAGLSGGEIARALGTSRNSVMGHLHRAGLFGSYKRPPKRPRVAAVSIELPAAGCCHYIFGERVEDYRYCGLPAEPERSWCPDHARIVYQPRPQKAGA